MKDEVLEFIEKRFKRDCNWVDGNCYYFAVILKTRFPDGDILYDVINGHFVFQYRGKAYDWIGIVEQTGVLVPWDEFGQYDSIQKHIIIRDCIM